MTQQSSLNAREALGHAAAAVAGSKLVQKVVGEAGKALGVDREQPNRAKQTLTISAGADELLGFFRDASSYERILRGVVEVEPAGDRALRWRVPVPDGEDLRLDVQLAEERPGELLRWTPASGSGGSAELEVRLRPAPVGDGTEVTMRFGLPPGDAGAATPRGVLAGALVIKALYRTKALFEAGEVPTLERNPSARPGEGDRI